MPILEMKHISKSFGGSHALKDVHLEIEEGEVHALLGENGAGKSTLMNILTGVYQADEGVFFWQGKEYVTPGIKEMENAGIAFVHQELSVINDLTVTDNIFINDEITNKLGIINYKEEVKRATELFAGLGVEIDPMAAVSTLKTSEKQLLEICRALYKDAKLIILDEPTTSLSNSEISHLFGILRNLKAKGKSFIFISHKMPEIFEIADRYTVFRNGEFISSGYIKDTDANRITSDMVGKVYSDTDLYRERPLGDTFLELKNYSGHGFSDINLQLKKGEIVAFTGLAGCGASELMQTMFGALPREGGHLIVNGKELDGDSILYYMNNRVALFPANRKENSVIPDMNIVENFSIAEHSISQKKKPVINHRQEAEKYALQKQNLNIKSGDIHELISGLSGGNQQKVFLAKWLNTGAEVMLFDNPTQGVDVGAKAEIYKLILDFAESGKTVIINTLEIPEIKKVADRCIVFYEGKIKKIFRHDEVNEHDVMLYSTNADKSSGEEN